MAIGRVAVRGGVAVGIPPETWAVELPVAAIDRQLGGFVLCPRRPTTGIDLPAGRRDLALTWADQLAFALDRPAPNGASCG